MSGRVHNLSLNILNLAKVRCPNTLLCIQHENLTRERCSALFSAIMLAATRFIACTPNFPLWDFFANTFLDIRPSLFVHLVKATKYWFISETIRFLPVFSIFSFNISMQNYWSRNFKFRFFLNLRFWNCPPSVQSVLVFSHLDSR